MKFFRYCTVMCNKGAHCDRSLCFFAHYPEELRLSLQTDAATMNDANFDLNPSEVAGDICESPSFGAVFGEKVKRHLFLHSRFVKMNEETKSSASFTSVTDSFRSTYDRFQEISCNKEPSHTKESIHDHASSFPNLNFPNFDVNPVPCSTTPFRTFEIHSSFGKCLFRGVRSDGDANSQCGCFSFFGHPSNLGPVCEFDDGQGPDVTSSFTEIFFCESNAAFVPNVSFLFTSGRVRPDRRLKNIRFGTLSL